MDKIQNAIQKISSGNLHGEQIVEVLDKELGKASYFVLCASAGPLIGGGFSTTMHAYVRKEPVLEILAWLQSAGFSVN